MTEQTKRALERLPTESRIGQILLDGVSEESAVMCALAARSRLLLETLDELCDELVGAGLCEREQKALHKAQALLRETARAMLSEK